jgi:CBS domain containing-hemolysin-like protein
LGGGLTHQEVAVINGAMDLTSKTALSGMTPIEKVRWGRGQANVAKGLSADAEHAQPAAGPSV